MRLGPKGRQVSGWLGGISWYCEEFIENVGSQRFVRLDDPVPVVGIKGDDLFLQLHPPQSVPHWPLLPAAMPRNPPATPTKASVPLPSVRSGLGWHSVHIPRMEDSGVGAVPRSHRVR